MQDKTAMQQMIGYLIFISNSSLSQQEQQDSILNKATELLEVEENNISDAFEAGFKDNSNETNPKFRDGNDYYQNKYKN